MEALLLLGVIIVLPGILAACWRFFLLFVSPEAYLQEKRHLHEREMSTRHRNNTLLGMVGRLFGL